MVLPAGCGDDGGGMNPESGTGSTTEVGTSVDTTADTSITQGSSPSSTSIGPTTGSDTDTSADTGDSSSSTGDPGTFVDYEVLSSSYIDAPPQGAARSQLSRDVAFDSQGNLVVVGGTSLPNFPTTAGAYDSTYGGPGTPNVGQFGDMDVFVSKFDPDAAPGDYTRVDRMGMPAIATAVISSKDAYNAADPANDAAGDFVGEITASVEFLHAGLDDDIMGAGLMPCAPMDCVGAAAPLVVPDTIKIDLTAAPGFPNGRQPADPVIDVTLALVLLDLGVHGVTDLVGVLNPAANDRSFGGSMPYLADPH